MLQRPLIAGAIGVGLVVVGTVLAWMHLHQQDSANVPAVSPASLAAPAPAVAPAAPARPAAPTMSIIAPSFDVVRINPQGDAVMAGRAAPNARVQIHDGQRRIGEVTADNRGEWVFVPNDPLPPGARELSLSARQGESETKSEQVVVLIVPERGKDLAGRPTTDATQPLAVATLRGGTGASTLLQGPAARAGDNAPRLSVDVVDYDTTGKVVLAGRAPPDTTVQIYIENKLIGRAQSNAAGRWMLIPESPLAPGLYTLRLDELAPDGRVAMRIEIPFQRAEVDSTDPAQTMVVVQPGDSLWRIARRSHGLGTAYTVIYEANRDQIRDPDLIYPGQVFSLSRTN